MEWTSNHGKCKRSAPPSLVRSFALLSQVVICIRANNDSFFDKFGDLSPAAAGCTGASLIRDILLTLYYRAAYLFCHQHPFRRAERRPSERGIRVPFPLIRRIRPNPVLANTIRVANRFVFFILEQSIRLERHNLTDTVLVTSDRYCRLNTLETKYVY